MDATMTLGIAIALLTALGHSSYLLWKNASSIICWALASCVGMFAIAGALVP